MIQIAELTEFIQDVFINYNKKKFCEILMRKEYVFILNHFLGKVIFILQKKFQISSLVLEVDHQSNDDDQNDKSENDS